MAPLLQNLAACCRTVSSTLLTVSWLKRAQRDASSGSTSSQWKHKEDTQSKQQENILNEKTKTKNLTETQIQCMMQSQNRHSRSLTFNLRPLSNSPRPPLADLYTTCIYKQYKGLTAVCTEGCQSVTDSLFFFSCCYYLVFQTSPVDQMLQETTTSFFVQVVSFYKYSIQSN